MRTPAGIPMGGRSRSNGTPRSVVLTGHLTNADPAIDLDCCWSTAGRRPGGNAPSHRGTRPTSRAVDSGKAADLFDRAAGLALRLHVNVNVNVNEAGLVGAVR